MNISVRVCRSCVERAQSDFLFRLGDRLCASLRRELERDGLTKTVDVAELSCFRNCPPRGVTATVAPRERPWKAERHTIRAYGDLDFFYACILEKLG